MAASSFLRALCMAALGLLLSGCALQQAEEEFVVVEPEPVMETSPRPDPSPGREVSGLAPIMRQEAVAPPDSVVPPTDEQSDGPDVLKSAEIDDNLPPLLPWPPPPASLAVTLKRQPLLAEIGGPEPDIGTVGDFLAEALAEAGYDGRLRYIGLEADASGRRYPDEFALVTGMEQIDEDAQPLSGPARWAEEIRIEAEFSVRNFLRALFFAPTGRYRVLVFVVTRRQIQGNSDVEISAEMVGSFSELGATSLPMPLRENVFGKRHKVTALIYEFEKAADNVQATQKSPSSSRASHHLAHTRLVPFMPGQ